MKRKELINIIMNERDFDFLCEKNNDPKELRRVKKLFKKRLGLRIKNYSPEQLEDYLKVTRGQMDPKLFDKKWPNTKTKKEVVNEIIEGKDWDGVNLFDRLLLKTKLKKKLLNNIIDYSDEQLNNYLLCARHDIDIDEYKNINQ